MNNLYFGRGSTMIEDRQAILITGGSAGIGAAFAKRYAAKGFDLVLCARRLDRLEATFDTLSKTHKITALALSEDLADPDAPARLIARVNAAGITLGGIVNNAGFGPRGFYAASPWSAHADFIQVMLTGPCHLAHLALPQMLQRRHGRIINIGSLAAFLPSSAEIGLYGAAKSFLIKFSEVLNLQCRGTVGAHQPEAGASAAHWSRTARFCAIHSPRTLARDGCGTMRLQRPLLRTPAAALELR